MFLGIGLAAAAGGMGLWLATRAPSPNPQVDTSQISAGAIQAATFMEGDRRRSLGELAGQVVVLNFWATWCAPCRAEMPAFERVQRRWSGRRVQFIGLSAEPPELVQRFAREVGVSYPLWTGHDDVAELSRRLGNRIGVLPHTVVLGPRMEVLEQKVGPYTEAELEELLTVIASKID
jgi:thiol-disulfide isomerase/thioredoxin